MKPPTPLLDTKIIRKLCAATLFEADGKKQKKNDANLGSLLCYDAGDDDAVKQLPRKGRYEPEVLLELILIECA